MEWIEGLNRARARLESEDRLTRSERLEDEIGIEPATQLNLEHEPEPEHEHDKGTAWRAIVPDLYGYGESSVVPGKTTLDIFASDIARLLDQLGFRMW